MRLLITGVSGQLGQAVVNHLLTRNPFDRIIGIDRAIPGLLGPVHFIEANLAEVDLSDLILMNDIDVVLHLAKAGPSEAATTDAALVRSILEAGSQVTHPRVVVPSRDWVYASQSSPCTEESPLLQTDDVQARLVRSARWRVLGPVESLVRVESELASFQSASPETELVIPRLSAVIGQGHDSTTNAILSAPYFFGPTGELPVYQFLDAEDAAALLIRCCTVEGLRGAYNIAGAEPLSFAQVAGILEKKSIRLPSVILRLVTAGLSQLGMLGFGYVELIRSQMGRPLVTSRADTALGRPRLTSRQALALWRSQIG